MKSDTLNATLTRHTLLETLTDDEIASVSMAETADSLPEGDEYLDLQALAKGVRRASANSVQMSRVLPKKAVHAVTWRKILAQLAAHGSNKAQAQS